MWAHCSTKRASVERAHPFCAATLADNDVTVNLAALPSLADRVAVVATESMTRNKSWHVMWPGELQIFVSGVSAI